MSDDIVTRLRKLSLFNKASRFGDLLEDWPGEAANEIERLRAENDGLRIRVFTLLKKLEEK
jgi:hypothetical protein